MMDGVKHTNDYWVMDAMIIAVGEAYETLKACLAGVASVKKNAVGAKIVAAS